MSKNTHDVLVTYDITSTVVDGSITSRKSFNIQGDWSVNVMIKSVTDEIYRQFSGMDNVKISHLSFHFQGAS